MVKNMLATEEYKIEFRKELKKFEYFMQIKADLIAKGISVKNRIAEGSAFNTKQIHLYQHHVATHSSPIPEDIILYPENEVIPKTVISKLRFNPDSEWYLDYEKGYKLRNDKKREEYSVTPTSPTNFDNQFIQNSPLSSIVQKLGIDVAGVIISNYCFYFKTKKECRFCEIYQTHKSHKTFTKATKPTKEIIDGLELAFQLDSNLKYILLNSGNIISYDQTVLEFIKIAQGIKELKENRNIDLIGILMPPENFSLMDEMKQAGFDKVYFDIEVFDPSLFQIIAPGKAEYGYKRMLSALEYAREIFGKGSSYSSFIYGLQSLPMDLNTSTWDPQIENQKALEAVDGLLDRGIVPLYCVYHYSGHNQIGPLILDAEALFEFSVQYGEKVYTSGVIPRSRDSVVYSSTSVTNTLLNDGYNLAKLKNLCLA
ncbi:radical SAM protein [Candidatus Rhabdochlamydia sp. T3358]|uniref:radical SAM protein n=1 Tax=Candidatus Rhabdochlamydia sp. T3358 TaxID=2099795 RepID=UPI0010B06F22|nr:radical SAM protein [Candidatus Rhabdochlamydia sp. T3358]VHO04727.1 Radical SAM superfamily protein [Candidatus Rhabdochlamydia sp. T3358]